MRPTGSADSQPVILYPPRSTLIGQAVPLLLIAGVIGFACWRLPSLTVWVSSELMSWAAATAGLALFFIFLTIFLAGCLRVWKLYSPVPVLRLDSFGIWSANGGRDLSLVLWREIRSLKIEKTVLGVECGEGGARRFDADDFLIPLTELRDQMAGLKARHEHQPPTPVAYSGKSAKPPALSLDASAISFGIGESSNEPRRLPWTEVSSVELRSAWSRGSKSTWVELHLKGGGRHVIRYGDVTFDGNLAVDPESLFKQIKLFREKHG